MFVVHGPRVSLIFSLVVLVLCFSFLFTSLCLSSMMCIRCSATICGKVFINLWVLYCAILSLVRCLMVDVCMVLVCLPW